MSGYDVCKHGRIRCAECAYVEELEDRIEELEQQNKRYREALEEILAESYEEAGLHPDTNMQLETFIAKTARKALEGELDA